MGRPARRYKRDKYVSPAQRHIQELGWFLYIQCGVSANFAHALEVNSYTLDTSDLRFIKRILKANEGLEQELREFIESKARTK